MKQLPIVIVMLLAVLVAVVTGCDGTPRYDTRLAAADSLMRDNPDSALAIIETINRGSLATTADTAYHDLLLTQARYRCYIVATSDSDINRALAYYRAHDGEREKLTRAYIYKGAVMEELGHPDSAMLYYKHAEATAAPDDYFNLGYTNMRMGALLRDHFATDGRHILKFEQALEYFNKTSNVNDRLIAKINLGSLYSSNSPLKADSLLKDALTIAKKNADTVHYIFAIQNLIKNNIQLRNYEEARQLAQRVIPMNSVFTDAAFYIYAADAYACLNMPDSALILLTKAENVSNGKTIDLLAYYDVMRDIATARGDLDASWFYQQQGSHIEDSLNRLDNSYRITVVDTSVEEKSHESLQEKLESMRWLIPFFVVAVIILLVFLSHIIIKHYRYKKLADELIQSYETQCEELYALQERIKAMDIRDGELKDFISANMNMVQEMIDECYRGVNIKQIKQKIEDIVSFQKKNKPQWLKLFSYLDLEYNNIITTTRENYPQLNEKELMLLALSTLDCSCVQIATILGYTNVTSVGPIRKRLENKMKLNQGLNQYIHQFKS